MGIIENVKDSIMGRKKEENSNGAKAELQGAKEQPKIPAHRSYSWRY